MEKELILRINELKKLSDTRELTTEEKEEQTVLRRKYIDGFKENFKAVLQGVKIQQPDGTIVPLKKKDL